MHYSYWPYILTIQISPDTCKCSKCRVYSKDSTNKTLALLHHKAQLGKLKSIFTKSFYPYCTFSSKALWCSNRDFRALRTSTSLETPEGDCACRFTTVILRDLSCLETRHSKCSSSSYWIWNKKLLISVPLNATEILTTVCRIPNSSFPFHCRRDCWNY